MNGNESASASEIGTVSQVELEADLCEADGIGIGNGDSKRTMNETHPSPLPSLSPCRFQVPYPHP